MSAFPSLFYTPTIEIPTLLYTATLKGYPFRAEPPRGPLWEVPPPPGLALIRWPKQHSDNHLTLPCLVLAVSTSACFIAIAKYYATLRLFSPVSPGSRHLAFPDVATLYNPSSLRCPIPIVPEYQFPLRCIGLPNMGKIIGMQYVQKKKIHFCLDRRSFQIQYAVHFLMVLPMLSV